jgi:uncharacterized membrane protein YbjE (DUF340 family)
MLNKVLNYSILLILLVMGYEFGNKSQNVASDLNNLLKIILIYVSLLLVVTYTVVYYFTKHFSWKTNALEKVSSEEKLTIFPYVKQSAKYVGYLVIGIVLGIILKHDLPYLSYIISFILLIILFIIGYQIRLQGTSLKNILINKVGILLSLLTTFSSLATGLLASFILGLKIQTGLALASGFGWYTLSGILTGGLINQQIGTAAFFIDFLREIIAIILIPVCVNKNPYPIIAYSGATALDFTLPVIKSNLGNEVVPVAISSGMLLTILVPILIPIICKIL